MKFVYSFFIYLFFLFTHYISLAQDKTVAFLLKKNVTTDFSLQNIHDFTALSKTLNHHGYYFYTTRLLKKDSLHDYHTVDLNNKIHIVAIEKIPNAIQEKFKLKKNVCFLETANVLKWIGQLMGYYDKKGENFTKIQLKNHRLRNDTLFCDLKINNSAKRYIDKIVVKGYNRFSKRFLKHYIATKRPFSKEILEATEKKINQLSFAQNKKKPAVLFTKDSTFLYLYLNRVKANKLDALLGFSNQNGESKIRFNGYVDISLVNALHKGENFKFKWNNTGSDQQEIDLHVKNPYILNTPINVGYQLNIFRKDSTFVNTKHQFSVGYKPHYKHITTAYYKSETSSVLKDTNSNIEAYRKNIFGFTYTYMDATSIGIPKFKIMTDVGYGHKKIASQKSTQLNFMSDFIYSLKINARNHLFLENRSAYLNTANKNTNELYRVGGATTMRGFLEQSIVADLYSYANIEYRYFTNTVSYLYGFGDVGYFKNINSKNNLLSLGLGYTLGTKSGLLKISYALGKSQNSAFDLSSGLFHINFVTIF